MKLHLLVCTICCIALLSSCRKNNDYPPAPELLTGFVYTIENVGGYWYNEVFNAGEKLKTISLDFR